jgi:hypothetical protein
VALTATSSYLVLHHAGALAPATAAVHGYSVAFAVSAVLFGVGALVAALLLPSRRRLEELRNAALTASAAPAPSAVRADRPVRADLPVAGGSPVADGSVQAAEPR